MASNCLIQKYTCGRKLDPGNSPSVASTTSRTSESVPRPPLWLSQTSALESRTVELVGLVIRAEVGKLCFTLPVAVAIITQNVAMTRMHKLLFVCFWGGGGGGG